LMLLSQVSQRLRDLGHPTFDSQLTPHSIQGCA